MCPAPGSRGAVPHSSATPGWHRRTFLSPRRRDPAPSRRWMRAPQSSWRPTHRGTPSHPLQAARVPRKGGRGSGERLDRDSDALAPWVGSKNVGGCERTRRVLESCLAVFGCWETYAERLSVRRRAWHYHHFGSADNQRQRDENSSTSLSTVSAVSSSTAATAPRRSRCERGRQITGFGTLTQNV
jgi:hypothetical protein